MKKIFLAVVMGLASYVGADSRNSYMFVTAQNLMQGDNSTVPAAVAGNGAVYWTTFKGNQVATMAAATGVSLTATFRLPTSIKPGGTMTIGFTSCYNGVTNSAVVSGTVKVQLGGYSDFGYLTATAVTVSPQIQLTNASDYGGPNMRELVDVANVYPGSIVTVYLERIAGTNQTLHFYDVWAKLEPSGGWWPF